MGHRRGRSASGGGSMRSSPATPPAGLSLQAAGPRRHPPQLPCSPCCRALRQSAIRARVTLSEVDRVNPTRPVGEGAVGRHRPFPSSGVAISYARIEPSTADATCFARASSDGTAQRRLPAFGTHRRVLEPQGRQVAQPDRRDRRSAPRGAGRRTCWARVSCVRPPASGKVSTGHRRRAALPGGHTSPTAASAAESTTT